MRVKLIIYKLFDRYVMASLEELYQEINAELMRAGVLPQLRHEVLRSGGRRPVPPAGVGRRYKATCPQPLQAATNQRSIGRTAANAAAHCSVRVAFASAPDWSARIRRCTHGPLPTANELIGALSVLQSQAATVQPAAARRQQRDGDQPSKCMHLKEQLM